MDQQNADRLGHEWIEAWNAHDLDRIMVHYSQDIEFTSPFIVALLGEASGTIRGRDALRSYFAKGLAAYPELRFDLHHVLAGVGSLTLVYTSVKNLLAAEVMLVDDSGRVGRVLAHYRPKSP